MNYLHVTSPPHSESKKQMYNNNVHMYNIVHSEQMNRNIKNESFGDDRIESF